MNAASPARSLPHPPRASEGAWVPLAARAPVALRRAICLHARLGSSDCRACVQACPTGALRLGAAGVELQERCTGCGRCHAACPTGALRVEGFALEMDAPATGSTLRLECARFAAPSAQGWVPCLGGISAAALLALCAAAPQRAVVLVDRGACAGCDSGGAEHPAAGVVTQVARWMQQAGVPAALLPRIDHAEVQPASADDPLQARGRARRGFFAALAHPAAPPALRSQDSSPRDAILSTLQALAARHGGRVAPELFHHLEVGASCKGLRVCAATCPTGALVRYRNDEAKLAGIAFDARDCIDCGHCAAVCPNQALRVLPGMGAGLGRRPLTRFLQRECADCGTRFTAPAGDDASRCERCRKSARLARAAFSALFPARTGLHGME